MWLSTNCPLTPQKTVSVCFRRYVVMMAENRCMSWWFITLFQVISQFVGETGSCFFAAVQVVGVHLVSPQPSNRISRLFNSITCRMTLEKQPIFMQTIRKLWSN